MTLQGLFCATDVRPGMMSYHQVNSLDLMYRISSILRDLVLSLVDAVLTSPPFRQSYSSVVPGFVFWLSVRVLDVSPVDYKP